MFGLDVEHCINSLKWLREEVAQDWLPKTDAKIRNLAILAVILHLSHYRFFRRDHDAFASFDITLSKINSRQPSGNTNRK